MSPPWIRRTLAGFALAMLLANAAPVGAAALRLPDGPGLQGLWSRAWSWLTDVWTGGSPERPAAPPSHGKEQPGPPPKPGLPPGANGNRGDQGSGVDPDG